MVRAFAVVRRIGEVRYRYESGDGAQRFAGSRLAHSV
jgi:hypothetical protein